MKSSALFVFFLLSSQICLAKGENGLGKLDILKTNDHAIQVTYDWADAGVDCGPGECSVDRSPVTLPLSSYFRANYQNSDLSASLSDEELHDVTGKAVEEMEKLITLISECTKKQINTNDNFSKEPDHNKLLCVGTPARELYAFLARLQDDDKMKEPSLRIMPVFAKSSSYDEHPAILQNNNNMNRFVRLTSLITLSQTILETVGIGTISCYGPGTSWVYASSSCTISTPFPKL
jgi:hypothetical protein